MADEEDSENWGTEYFLRLLINTAVDGSQQLQLDLQPNVHVVRIPTGNIKATDFKKMTSEAVEILIENGKKTTRTFFEQELLQVRPNGSSSSVCEGEDELYTRVTETLDLPLNRVVIADHDTDWVYSLFPSLMYWRAKGVRVDVLLPELGDKTDGTYRRKLLRAMGVHLTELHRATSVPIRSFVMVPQDADQLRAIVGVEKQSHSQTIEAVLYDQFLHTAAIGAVLAQLEKLIEPYPTTTPARLELSAGGHELLLTRLQTVRQYSGPNIELSIENIPVEKLVSLAQFVREFKYRQIRHLVELYNQASISLFDPAIVTLDKGIESLLTPPVVEESGGQFILVEGSTRATFCRDEGIPQLKCVVVRGVTAPLPSKPFPFKQVRVLGRTLEPRQRYEHFDYSHFRSIERAVHPLNSLA